MQLYLNQTTIRKLNVVFLSILYFSISSFSQKAIVKGKLTDKNTDEPLIGVNIFANVTGVITDTLGYYEISLDPGNYSLEYSYVGFRKRVVNAKLAASEIKEIDVALSSTNILLEEATITSSKYEQRIAESTISVDIINVELLESINAVTADEVLEKVTGVQILDDQPNIRGGSGWSYGAGSRVMLLIDDMPALQADAGLPQWTDIPVENISQIEIVKGAASALYGSSALNGIINIRTGYATSDPETKISIFHNRFMDPKDPNKKWWTETPRNFGFSAMHKQKFGKLDLVAGIHHFNHDSLHTYNQESFRSKTRYNMNLRYRFTDRLSVGLNSFFNDGESSSFFLWQNGTGGAYKPFPGTVTRSKNLRYIIDPHLTYFDKKNNKHRIQSRYYYIDNDNNLNQSNSSKLFFLEYQFQRKFDSGLTLTAGTLGTWMSSDSELFSDTLITSRNYAGYFQLDKKFFEKLNLTFGSRYEYNRQNTPEVVQGEEIPGGVLSEGKFITRVGMNFEVSDESFLRASWGQGYRYPTIVERFIRTDFSGFTIFPNARLESETGWSAELGLKQGFNLLRFQGFFDFAAFISEYSNMMEFTFFSADGEVGFQSQNIGDTRIKGFEMSVMGQSKIFEIPFRLYAGYTFTDPKYQNFTEQLASGSSADFNVLKYRTKHHFTVDFEAQWKKISIGVANLYTSHMLAVDQALAAFATISQYREANDSGYMKLDARIAYSFNWAKLSFIMNNILNAEYTERPARLEPPRNIGMRLDFTL